MEQNNRTLSGLFGKKVLDTFEALSLSQTFKKGCLITFSIGLTAILAEPQQCGHYLLLLVGVSNYLPVKFIVVTTVVFHSQTVYKFVKKAMRKNPNTSLIEGIPTMELLDHLFIEGSFKREEVKKKFGIAHDRFQKLAEKFESLEVLIRGENNSRVLNPSYTRQDLAAILKGKTKAEEIESTLRRASEGEWTTEPMAERIQERVEEMLDSTSLPVFTIKRLSM